MCPIFVWVREPEGLSRQRYPEAYERFAISAVDACPTEAGVLVVDDETLASERPAIEAWVRSVGAVSPPILILSSESDDEFLFDVLGEQPSEKALARKLRNAVRHLENQLVLEASRKAADKTRSQLEQLHAIAVALSAERDHERLLNLILTKAREITNADAGSLFLVSRLDERIVHPDGTEGHVTARWLKFRLAQNDSLSTRFEEEALPISPDSIAGYVAQTRETLNLEDAYAPLEDKPFTINRSFDEATEYRTRSMLVVPMETTEGETIGVLQLINKKSSPEVVLDSKEGFEKQVFPFDEHDERLVRSLASQAAVSVENNSLYRGREHLFRQFVDAAVKAIESRDETTQGHSKRVARMTKALAEVTNRADRGRYADFHLSADEIRELNYAALLHDFGKVGVSEKVLIKGTKLYHGELSLVRQRFQTIRRGLEAQYLRGMLDRLLKEGASSEQIEQMKEELRRRLFLVEEARKTVERANEPTVTYSADFDKLNELGRLTYEGPDGTELPYLEPRELESLSVPRGTLTAKEFEQIQSHVKHTYDFLSTIPWTHDLRAIPELARSHHEKLDGTGYPNQRRADEILPQTRMMTISDIYDALTASDRPYKKAVPTEKALGILEDDFDGKVDEDLLGLFIEARVFEHGLVSS